ncbi:MAG: 50S ribosomal protein L28 [Bdellovibrionales bacterium]|nr:50S ribosomal protein L28 [Bdellovibrionales bacterium]
MPQCELTGKGPVVKNLVSHSNIKTKSIARPNIQQKKLFSQALNESFSLKLATSTIRSIEHGGGFDSFLLKQNDSKLSKRALKLKQRIKSKLNLNSAQ